MKQKTWIFKASGSLFLVFLLGLSLLMSFAMAEENTLEAVQLPEITEDALPMQQSQNGSAIFGIAVMGKEKDVEISWEGNYTFVQVTGTYKSPKPSLVYAAPGSRDGLQVIEAWKVQNIKKNTALSMTIRLNALPTLAEGESLAFYALKNGEITNDPLMEDLSVGDLANIQLEFKGNDGIALARVAADPGDLPVDDQIIWANEDIYLTGKMPGNAVVDAAPVTVEVDGEIVLAAYDVRIYTNEKKREKGMTWQPSDKKVQVHFFNEAFRDGQEMNVYHLTDGNSLPEKVATVTAEDNWITFEAESFSTYAVTVREKIVEASNGETYKITVTYDAASGIPADAQVEAAEISDSSKIYKEYLIRTAQALDVDISSVVYSRLFDISLVGPDGTKYQPDDDVTVSIQLLKDAAEDMAQVRVVHFAEEQQGVQPVKLNAAQPTRSASSELTATAEGTTVSFKTSGFSMFSLIDTHVGNGGEVNAVPANTSDSITLGGPVPTHGILEAISVEAEIDGMASLLAYDITVYANSTMKNIGIAWQPSSSPVQVTLHSDDLTAERVDIYHISSEDAQPQLVAEALKVVNGSVTFNASSFSVYVVIDHEGGTVITPHVEFHFIEAYFGEPTSDGTNAYYAVAPYKFKNKHGDDQTTQILKNGESLELIEDPHNRDNQFFYGWYVVEPYTGEESDGFGRTNGTITSIYYTWPEGPNRIRFESPITITESNVAIGGTVHWSLDGVSGSGAVAADGSVHVLLAPVFQNYLFANFMQFARNYAGTGASASNLMTRKLLVLGSASSVNVKISDIQATSTDSVRLIFKGWEYNAGTEQNPNWIRLDTVDFTGREIETFVAASDDIDLYPIFIEARWTDFNVGPTGNGASYVPSRFLLAWEDGGNNVGLTENEGQSVFTKLEAPVRQGYDFGGWYAEVTDYNAETGEFTTGTCITDAVITNGEVAVLGGTTISGTYNAGKKTWEVADGKLKFYDGLTRLTLYAKWLPASSRITIIYWTENAENANYQSRAVKTVTTAELNTRLGTSLASGSAITLDQLQQYEIDGVSVLSRDYLDDVGAVPAGEQIFFDLKTAKKDANDTLFEASKVISGEGTTLFNVYYSRKVFTLVFHIGRDGYISTSGEQTNSNSGSWLQKFYDDDIAKVYDDAEGTVPSGSRGKSMAAMATMTYNGVTYTNEYATNSSNVKNSYVPSDDENVYTIKAKYGAYIGNRWPTPTNDAFTFTLTGQNKEMYTWSAYYGSRFTQLANDRKGSGQNWHPDINGVYSYMSAELCANREGTAIINDNQVHHLVAYFGDLNKAGVRKNYHILYEAVDGTYDPNAVTIVPGSSYTEYTRTTWTINVAQADTSLIADRSFYEISNYVAISNLNPESQLASNIEGYELIYSCYNTPENHEHHIYFFYRPKEYTITFKYEVEADRKTDSYYYTQSLAEADKYTPPERTGYRFLGWYINEAGSGEPFDFANTTMPAMNLVLYPVMVILQYMVKIDPNGGVIDHINYNAASAYGVSGTGHNSSQATYFTADYGTPIAPYTVERDYVQLSGNELDSTHSSYYSGPKYYYVNAQFNAATDGDWGLPPDIRNAVYLTSDGTKSSTDQLYCYFLYCENVIDVNSDYYTNVDRLDWDQFASTYTSYPNTAYRPVSSEHYTFMGWYQVYDNGAEASMPYNFNDPVYGEITLRAKWRLDGGIYVKYNPYFFVENEGNVTAVIGEIDEWTDPADTTKQLYADQSPTNIFRAPTNISATDGQDWVFRGWRVVKPEGTSSSFESGGHTYTYQKWTPIQLDGSGLPIYYNPGEDFIIDSALISQNDEYGGVIHMQAYYELLNDSYRRPDVTNLILDANDDYGGYVNTSDSTLLPALTAPGHQAINTTTELVSGSRPTQIEIGDLQSNLALHLYRYATTQTHHEVTGTNFFSNGENYLLIGFDENIDPTSPTTGQAYIPAFAADSVAAVTRNDNRTLYAMWEPMVYVTFVNTTGADLVVNLTGTGASTVSIVNEVTGEFDREQTTTQITVPAKSGDTNGQVKIVLPRAVPSSNRITATAVNGHANYKLSVGGVFGAEDPYGTGSSDIRYGNEATYTGTLQYGAAGVIITYTEEEEPSVIFDVNGGTWQETDTSFVHSPLDTDIYTILKPAVETLGRYKPADPSLTDKFFLGWTTNADIAGHTDFSATEAVTWGDTTITPDSGANVLEKIRSGGYLWDFSQEPPYGQTLYAVWSDTVTVTFNLIRTGNYNHNWTGPATSEENGAYVYYRKGGTSHDVQYTLCKGEKVPRPQDPTVDTAWNRPDFTFLEWLTDNSKVNTNTNPAAIEPALFDFTAPVLSDRTVYTSWMSTQFVRKYTYTVKNEIIGGTAGEEFDYTITAAFNMNYSGTYYESGPTFLPVTTRLKNTETYTVEITAVRYDSGWNHNSLYLVVADRDGAVIGSGHLIEYHKNATTIEVETSDYQVALTVTQTPKDGYTTTVTAPDGTTADLGVQEYVFKAGKGNNATSRIVTTEEDSFTFHSSHSSNGAIDFVGVNKNNGIGTGVSDVAETIIFTNSTGVILYPSPTGIVLRVAPYAVMLIVGVFLAAVAIRGSKRKKKDENKEF